MCQYSLHDCAVGVSLTFFSRPLMCICILTSWWPHYLYFTLFHFTPAIHFQCILNTSGCHVFAVFSGGTVPLEEVHKQRNCNAWQIRIGGRTVISQTQMLGTGLRTAWWERPHWAGKSFLLDAGFVFLQAGGWICAKAETKQERLWGPVSEGLSWLSENSELIL